MLYAFQRHIDLGALRFLVGWLFGDFLFAVVSRWQRHRAVQQDKWATRTPPSTDRTIHTLREQRVHADVVQERLLQLGLEGWLTSFSFPRRRTARQPHEFCFATARAVRLLLPRQPGSACLFHQQTWHTERSYSTLTAVHRNGTRRKMVRDKCFGVGSGNFNCTVWNCRIARLTANMKNELQNRTFDGLRHHPPDM